MNGHAEKVKAALHRGEADSRLLDGRDFDAVYWQRARASLAVLLRQLEQAQSQRDAFAAVVKARGDRDVAVVVAERQQAIDALRLADKALQIVQTRRLRFSAEAAYRKLHGLPSDRSPEEVALDDAVAAYFDSAALEKLGEKP